MRAALITIRLKSPIGAALSELFITASIWGFQVIESSTHKRTAKIRIPLDDYQRMFSEVPKKGPPEVPPPPLNDFMDSMEITEVVNV